MTSLLEMFIKNIILLPCERGIEKNLPPTVTIHHIAENPL
jgi:hypothetical protein